MEAQESPAAEQTPPPTHLGKNKRILGDKVAATHAVTVMSCFMVPVQAVAVVHDGTHGWCWSGCSLAGSRKNRICDSGPDRAGGRGLAQGRQVERLKV